MNTRLESFSYDDDISRKFVFVTFFWGIVAFLVGLIAAIELANPAFNLGIPWLTFGRIRPLHTNAAIFAFAGNAIFSAVYYSTQRLLKTPMFSRTLSRIHFWGWQLIIVAGAITLPLGYSQGKEYAELEWPLDLAVVIIWVVFSINFFGTIAKRRERHLYVAIWFYIATIIAIAMLYIFNNLALPAGWLKSYSLYAGVQDAFMQWWYGHNAVAFVLTTPFLGLMYYFLPKAADRPVYSYKLSILHFWSLIFIYIWAGPHHLHYTALPGWASTLGMVFSLMLWMPSWGGMLNGLLTLRGAWDRVAADHVLKFFVVSVTFYGMSTFEGPTLAIKSVNVLSHYTDWTIAHVHAGTLGWVGFGTFAMIYWLVPRLYHTELWSRKLAEVHFWIGTLGILLYLVSIYAAGLTQGLMWLAFDKAGYLKYGDFVETTLRLLPMYWVRFIGGSLYLAGALMMGLNMLMTWRRRPRPYPEQIFQAPALTKVEPEPIPMPSPLTEEGLPVSEAGVKLEYFASARWHRLWEAKPFKFTVWVTIAVATGSLFEAIPTFLIKSNVPTIASVKPYTPLELAGRDIYVAEGCYNCHSQMVRPIRAETERYGEYSKPGEFVYDHPFQWGSRRIGPDLHRVGGKYPDLWHLRHMADPQSITPGSIMPVFPWLLKDDLNFDKIQAGVRAQKRLGVPYTEEEVSGAAGLARDQAMKIGTKLDQESGMQGLQDKEIVALIAYLQRLGTDIKKPLETAASPPASQSEDGAGSAAPEAEVKAGGNSEESSGEAS